MCSYIQRYLILAVLLFLLSCSSKTLFKTNDLKNDNTVIINVDKRINFAGIDGKTVNFKSDLDYSVELNGGNHTLTIFFTERYSKNKFIKTDPVNFEVNISTNKIYRLYARDYKDRKKAGLKPEMETYLVHYFLESDGEKTQIFKSYCRTDIINKETVKCLINNKENLDRRYGNNRDLAIIHSAVRNGCKECIELLVDNGADIDRKTRAKGLTPLHSAVLENNIEIVKTLTEKDAKINLPDKNKATPLHYACEKGYYNIASYLIKKGAKKDLKDKKGLRPFDYAKRSNHTALFSLFKNSYKKKTVKKKVPEKIVKVIKKKRVLKKKKKVSGKARASVKKKRKIRKKKTRRKKVIVKKRKKRKKPKDEEDRLPPRKNPVPDIYCSSQECYASITDRIESALSKIKFSRLEQQDLRKVAYIYFQISKLCNRTTPDSAREEFSKASELFKTMKFSKKSMHRERLRIISRANKHITKAARLIVKDADKKLNKLKN